MTVTLRKMRIAPILAAAILVAFGVAFSGLGATPAHAAGRVSVSGPAQANAETDVQVSGSEFQSVQGGFGGIYVLFGWVDSPESGSWKPSQGGVTGENYRYVYDDETNPLGYQLFVSFPGSSTTYAANGGEVASDGTWSGTIRIPGAVFETYDRDGNATTVDCTQVTCGIITIGAHGVKNANNETFTPITFSGSPAATEAASPAAPAPTASENGAQQVQATQQSVPAPAPAATQAATSIPATIVQQGESTSSDLLAWLVVLVPVGFLIALTVIALAVGVGAYLAAKSLILGVNPEALEKVRGKRERKALAERERQRRKTAEMRMTQDRRNARARQRAGRHDDSEVLTKQSSRASETSPSRVYSFFSEPASHSSLGALSDAGDASASAPDAPTQVLTQVSNSQGARS